MAHSGPRTGAGLNQLETLSGAAILLRGDRIVAAGPFDEVAPRARDAIVIDAGGRCVTPGLVDAHTHLAFGGNRSEEFERRCQGATYQEIAASGGGIQSTVRQTRACVDIASIAKRNFDRMLRAGTTTIEAKSGYGLQFEHELETLRAYRQLGNSVIPTYLGAHAYPAGVSQPDYLREVEKTIAVVANEGLAEYFDAFVEESYFSPDTVRHLCQTAKSAGLKIRLHVDQLRDGNGALLAAELGATSADHLEHTSAKGIWALAKAGVYPILLPASVFGIGSRRYPAGREMIEAGLPVVLATDFNPGSSPTWNLLFVMSLACLEMGMTAAECLWATTVNAAHSLGRGHEVGSLEAGKRADLVIWDANDVRELPYWFASLRPHLVIHQGQPLVQS